MRGFVKVGSVSHLRDNTAFHVDIGRVPVCLVRTGGEVLAVRDECSHGEVALSDGDVFGDTIECWLHGSRFDLRTGEPNALPATKPVPVYPVRIDGDDIFVAVKE